MKTLAPMLLLFAACWFGCKNADDLKPVSKPGITNNQGSNFYFPKDYSPGEVIKIENGKSVFYVEKDGDKYRMDGDVLLTPQQVNALKADSASRAITGDVYKLWPGGVVPFTINANVSATGQFFINQAIQHWQANTPVTFVPRSNQGDYIEFEASNVNDSYIGKIGGRQAVRFIESTSCALVHELGHAVGLFHEQSRVDRDNFIIIDWNNIRPNMQFNFSTYAQLGESGFDLGTFDFNSIMMYPMVISDPNFVFNTTIPTITSRDGIPFFPNTCTLSPGDQQSVDALYRPIFLRAVYTYDDRSSDWEMDVTTYLSVQVFSDAAGTVPINLPRRLRVGYRNSFFEHPSTSGGFDGIVTLEPGEQNYAITSGVSGCRYDGSMNPVPGCRWTSLALLNGPAYTVVP